MTLRFKTPEPDVELSHLTETRHKYLQSWLEQLHTQNPQTASSTILTALSALNRQPLASDIRLRLLTLYWNTIQIEVNMLQRQLSGSLLPLSEKSDADTKLACDLLLELGNGYKLILMDNSASQLNFHSKPDPAVVIYQLMLIQYRILELCYEMYLPVPSGLWMEIHQIFQYAEGLGETQLNISEPVPGTIIHVYQQMLLIALADPYHLMQGELAQVIELTHEFALLGEIERSHIAEHNAHVFTLNLNKDAPPHITTRLETQVHREPVRFFNTLALIEHLLFLLAKLESGAPPPILGLPAAAAEPNYRYLLHRLIRSWGIPHLRQFSRHDKQLDDIELNLGLRAVHTLLNSHTSATTSSQSYIEIPTVVVDIKEEANTRSGKWQLLNTSAQGNALRNQGSTPGHIKVGELIAMRESLNDPWNVCSIQWIKNIDMLTIEIGVQLLPPNGHPVSVRNVLSPLKNIQPGILFPENTTLKQHHQILTPHGLYKKNTVMELITDTTYQITTGKLILQTQSFDLFEFSVKSQKKN